MTLEVRDFTMVGQFAKNAQTNIPAIPISGQAYRDPGVSKTQIEFGQAYDQIGASAFWNQLLYLATGIARMSESFGYVPWSAFTDYVGDASWCLGQDGTPYHAIADSGPGDASSPGVGAKPPPDEEYWETLAGYVYRRLSEGDGGGGSGGEGGEGGDSGGTGGGGLFGGGGVIIGEIRLLPFRIADLPAGWHYPSGQYYELTSDIGKALNGLPTNFKADWGITISGNTIRLCDNAKFFSGANGRFFRSTLGNPGVVQEASAAMAAHSHTIPIGSGSSMTGGYSKPVWQTSSSGSGGNVKGHAMSTSSAGSAAENRPANVSLTPAIYLGV
jgi:hypothetical protein